MVVCMSVCARASSVPDKDEDSVVVYLPSWSREAGERTPSNEGGTAAHCSIVCACRAVPCMRAGKKAKRQRTNSQSEEEGSQMQSQGWDGREREERARVDNMSRVPSKAFSTVIRIDFEFKCFH